MSFKNYKKSIVLDFDYETVKEGVPKASRQMALLNSEFRVQMDLVEKTGSTVAKLSLEQQRYASQVSIQQGKIKALTEELDKLENSETKNTDAIARKTIELNNAQKQLGYYEDRLAETNKSLEAHSGKLGEVSDSYKVWKKELEESGFNLDEFADKGQKVGMVISGITMAGMKMAGDVDQIMAQTNTIADTSVVSLEELRAGVLEVSKAYNIASTDVATGLYNINSGNIETVESLKLLDDAAKLAKAGFTDMETSTKLLTQIINAYGLEVGNASDITDKLIKMQKLGQITVGEFGEGFGKLAGLAGKANIPLEDVMGSISTMTALGMEPAEAMTALSAVLTQIVKPSQQASKAAKEYGVQLNLAAVESMGFAGWLEHVNEKTRGSDEALTELFGSANSIKSMFTLTGQGAKKFSDDIQELGDSAGYTDEALEKLNTSHERFSNAINRMKIALIEVGAAFSPLLNILAFFIEVISNIPKPILVIISVGGMLLLGITSMIKLATKLTDSVGLMSSTFGMTLNPALLKTLGTLLLIITAVSILVALIITLTGKTKEASGLLKQMGNSAGNLQSNVNQGQNNAKRNVQGSYASGIARVSGNRVRAELHDGEEVLTRDDPRNQNNPNFNTGGFGDINITVQADELQSMADVVRLFEDLKRTKRGGIALG